MPDNAAQRYDDWPMASHFWSQGGEHSEAIMNTAGEGPPPSQPINPVSNQRHMNTDTRYVEAFPDTHYAGATYGTASTFFDQTRDSLLRKPDGSILGPFRNEGEWRLAKWLVKNVGHNQAEEFLKLAVVRSITI